jgi:hypothetical protein
VFEGVAMVMMKNAADEEAVRVEEVRKNARIT